jgi:hypothetical protein
VLMLQTTASPCGAGSRCARCSGATKGGIAGCIVPNAARTVGILRSVILKHLDSRTLADEGGTQRFRIGVAEARSNR